ncbi:MAG: HmuY family protein [Gemmatimonadota bacterium]|nr:HmuY family protein [Gemmatimonadota bacterium]
MVIATIFVSSFQRPDVVSYAPTTELPGAAGGALVTATVTLDARDGEAWTFYSFDRGATIDGTRDPEWDVAFQRFHFVTNGGEGYPGEAGALALEAPFDSVAEAPIDGYAATTGRLADGPVNPELERWYEYSFFAHTLRPKPATYVIRTADRRFAKLEILSYYCPEATPGCITFRYAYQGSGARALE